MKVLYEYQGDPGADELVLYPNEVVGVVQQDDSGWWQGQKEDGSVGWFPNNFVEEIAFSETFNSSPKPSPSSMQSRQVLATTVEEDVGDVGEKLDKVTSKTDRLESVKKVGRKAKPPSKGFKPGATVETVERVEKQEPPPEEDSGGSVRRPMMGIPMMGMPIGMGGLNMQELKGKLGTATLKKTQPKVPPSNNTTNPPPPLGPSALKKAPPKMPHKHNNDAPLPKSGLKIGPVKKTPNPSPLKQSGENIPPPSKMPSPSKTPNKVASKAPPSSPLDPQTPPEQPQQPQVTKKRPSKNIPPREVRASLPVGALQPNSLPFSHHPSPFKSSISNPPPSPIQNPPPPSPIQNPPPSPIQNPPPFIPPPVYNPPPFIAPPAVSSPPETQQPQPPKANLKPSQPSSPSSWPSNLPPFPSFCEEVKNIFEREKSGKGLSVVEESEGSKLNEGKYSFCIVNKNGEIFKGGEEEVFFSLKEGVSPFLYDILLQDYSISPELNKFHSNQTSNNNSLTNGTKPDNPFHLKGFACLSSIAFDKFGNNSQERISTFTEKMKGFLPKGKGRVCCSLSSYLSQKSNDDLSSAIFHLLKLCSTLPTNKKGEELSPLIDFFFQISSLEMSCQDLALSGLSLSKEAFESLKLFSQTKTGAFISSRSGATLLVVKDVVSIAIYSPLIDTNGNSSRGVAVAKEILSKFFE